MPSSMKVIHCFQNMPSGVSSKMTGAGVVLPVSSSVKTSKSSSIVPRPPGRTTNAFEGRVRATLRVKKYFMVTRLSTVSM